MKIDGYSGACWGYNFDWQSRNFFAPRNTPTIVPTAFAARALIEAGSQDLQDEERSVCEFIVKDLPRPIDTESEVCFSYAPNTNTRIFNASLLAAEVLANVGAQTGEQELIDYADRAARYVVNNQQPDGSWWYGTDPKQSWIDNFHTAYVLFSLKRIIDVSSRRDEFQQALERGYRYWKNTFFLADGWPKYYDHDLYPADAHAAASAIVTFLECRELDNDALRLAQTVATWTIQNLRDSRGFFYYQRRRFYTVRKPYMRWTQAWMLYALSRLLEELNRR
jgi:rhamnogalacturonyl hydrolase YesR